MPYVSKCPHEAFFMEHNKIDLLKRGFISTPKQGGGENAPKKSL